MKKILILSILSIALLMISACNRNDPYENAKDKSKYSFSLETLLGGGTPILTLSPTTQYLQKNETYTFSATGGTAPYTFSISAGPGSIGAGTGIFTAPPAPGTSTVRVTDNDGIFKEAAVETLADPLDTAVGNLKLWLKPATLSLLNNDPVNTWPDSAGTNDASQTDSAQQPTYITNGCNGRPVVRFNHVLEPGNNLTLGANYLFSTNNGITIFAVCRSNSITSPSSWEFVFGFGYLAGKGYGFSYRCASARYYTATSDGGIDTSYTITPPRTPADFVVICFRVEFNVNQRIYIDGALIQENPTLPALLALSSLTAAEIDESPTRTTSTGPVVIGGMSKLPLNATQFDRYFNGDIAEVIYYDIALTDLQRNNIEYYLAKKWGL